MKPAFDPIPNYRSLPETNKKPKTRKMRNNLSLQCISEEIQSHIQGKHLLDNIRIQKFMQVISQMEAKSRNKIKKIQSRTNILKMIRKHNDIFVDKLMSSSLQDLTQNSDISQDQNVSDDHKHTFNLKTLLSEDLFSSENTQMDIKKNSTFSSNPNEIQYGTGLKSTHLCTDQELSFNTNMLTNQNCIFLNSSDLNNTQEMDLTLHKTHTLQTPLENKFSPINDKDTLTVDETISTFDLLSEINSKLIECKSEYPHPTGNKVIRPVDEPGSMLNPTNEIKSKLTDCTSDFSPHSTSGKRMLSSIDESLSILKPLNDMNSKITDCASEFSHPTSDKRLLPIDKTVSVLNSLKAMHSNLIDGECEFSHSRNNKGMLPIDETTSLDLLNEIDSKSIDFTSSNPHVTINKEDETISTLDQLNEINSRSIECTSSVPNSTNNEGMFKIDESFSTLNELNYKVIEYTSSAPQLTSSKELLMIDGTISTLDPLNETNSRRIECISGFSHPRRNKEVLTTDETFSTLDEVNSKLIDCTSIISHPTSSKQMLMVDETMSTLGPVNETNPKPIECIRECSHPTSNKRMLPIDATSFMFDPLNETNSKSIECAGFMHPEHNKEKLPINETMSTLDPLNKLNFKTIECISPKKARTCGDIVNELTNLVSNLLNITDNRGENKKNVDNILKSKGEVSITEVNKLRNEIKKSYSREMSKVIYKIGTNSCSWEDMSDTIAQTSHLNQRISSLMINAFGSVKYEQHQKFYKSLGENVEKELTFRLEPKDLHELDLKTVIEESITICQDISSNFQERLSIADMSSNPLDEEEISGFKYLDWRIDSAF